MVAFAESVDHVSQVAKLCNDNEVPLIPFGSGTGLEGGVNAIKVYHINFVVPDFTFDIDIDMIFYLQCNYFSISKHPKTNDY